MSRTTKWIIFASFFAFSSCTDLVAVYKHDVLLLRDVDKISSGSPPVGWESHVLKVPKPFSYPVGLTYDPKGRRLFVAEAVHEDSKIFSLDLDGDYVVKDMKSVVRTTNTTIMEGLTYDPRTEHLYWTDSYNHGVYKTLVSKEQKENPAPEPAHMFGGVIEPRGIAIDYCNELMYWSERDASGKVPSSIEVCDLHGPSHTVLMQDEEKKVKIFYQGLTYDIQGGKLLWAETIGDDFEKSYCRIVSYEFGQTLPEREVLVSLENCYPFSLTTDENFIYWADWGQQGIMRASRKNPNDVVKLAHTPQIESKYGEHHGVYGLAILGGLADDSLQEACKGKINPQRQSVEKDDSAIFNPPTLRKEIDTKQKSEIENSEQISQLENSEDVSSDGQKIGQSLGHLNEHQPEESQELALLTTGSTEKLLMQSHMCTENQLLIVVIVLGFFCIMFFLSTLALVYKLWFRHKSESSCKELPVTVSERVLPHQPKRFGPKVRPVGKGASCSGAGHDGVSINIEDCCQMTLCDTPCYTTIKKEGRGYNVKNLCTKPGADDKKGLLDDMDDLSNL
ncbi:protein cueball-like [Palaemon carinicauda]|uniref:protein cueball-like n=1 Tax=Palaemon carinicauda TaxID=392227 RepID=UPI0035B67FDD